MLAAPVRAIGGGGKQGRACLVGCVCLVWESKNRRGPRKGSVTHEQLNWRPRLGVHKRGKRGGRGSARRSTLDDEIDGGRGVVWNGARPR